MTVRTFLPASLLTRLGSLGGAVLLAAACTNPSLPTHREAPHTETFESNNPVVVQETIATLTLEGDGVVAELSAEEIERVRAFTDRFIRQGGGRLVVTIAGGMAKENVSLSRGKQAAYEAVRFGVSLDDIAVRVDEAAERVADIVVLSFETYTARLPACRDWSKENSHDPTNSLYPDTGCSTQNNTALMVAHTGDLIEQQPQSSTDAAVSEHVATNYRKGVITLTPRHPEEALGTAIIEN